MGDSLLRRIKHRFRSSSKASARPHERTGEEGADLRMTPLAKVLPYQDVLDEAYHAGYAKATSRLPLPSNSAEHSRLDPYSSEMARPDEPPQHREMNVTQVPHHSSGNYTNEYGPTSQVAVAGSITGKDVGVVANSNPSYQVDAVVETGRGFFFKPKSLDLGTFPTPRDPNRLLGTPDGGKKINGHPPDKPPAESNTVTIKRKNTTNSDKMNATNFERISSTNFDRGNIVKGNGSTPAKGNGSTSAKGNGLTPAKAAPLSQKTSPGERGQHGSISLACSGKNDRAANTDSKPIPVNPHNSGPEKAGNLARDTREGSGNGAPARNGVTSSVKPNNEQPARNGPNFLEKTGHEISARNGDNSFEGASNKKFGANSVENAGTEESSTNGAKSVGRTNNKTSARDESKSSERTGYEKSTSNYRSSTENNGHTSTTDTTKKEKGNNKSPANNHSNTKGLRTSSLGQAQRTHPPVESFLSPEKYDELALAIQAEIAETQLEIDRLQQQVKDA